MYIIFQTKRAIPQTDKRIAELLSVLGHPVEAYVIKPTYDPSDYVAIKVKFWIDVMPIVFILERTYTLHLLYVGELLIPDFTSAFSGCSTEVE